jgi:hypothetical protein
MKAWRADREHEAWFCVFEGERCFVAYRAPSDTRRGMPFAFSSLLLPSGPADLSEARLAAR